MPFFFESERIFSRLMILITRGLWRLSCLRWINSHVYQNGTSLSPLNTSWDFGVEVRNMDL